MGSQNNITIIIQARTGSTRLPNKMLLPIHNGKTILEIIVLNLLNYFDPSQIVIATSTIEKDNAIEMLAKKLRVQSFRGSENDVLDRFIKAAESFKADKVIRVCADNPLLQADQLKLLANEFLKTQCDYLSFAYSDGTPVIKAHIGLFAEAVSLMALKKAAELTTESLYHEHVTNYIYSHPQKFKINFLPLPSELKDRKEVRLTVDTQEDFDSVKEIVEGNYSGSNYEIPISKILNYIDSNDRLIKSMKNEIERNTK